MGRLWAAQGRPASVLLERGTWESGRVQELCAAAEVERIHVYSPRHKLVEPAFGRLWTRMSGGEKVGLGRYRGDDEAGNRLYARLQRGSADPRQHCQSLAETMAAIAEAVRRHNEEPVRTATGEVYLPAERWAADRALRGPDFRRPAQGDWRWAQAPERRELTVRQASVEAIVTDPVLGLRQPYRWTWPTAWQAEGARVRVYFDPAADDGRARVVALTGGAWGEANTVLAEAAAPVSDIVAVRHDGTLDLDGGGMERTRRAKQMHRASRRTEFRAVAAEGGGKATAWASEAVDAAGRVTETSVVRRGGSPVAEPSLTSRGDRGGVAEATPAPSRASRVEELAAAGASAWDELADLQWQQ